MLPQVGPIGGVFVPARAGSVIAAAGSELRRPFGSATAAIEERRLVDGLNQGAALKLDYPAPVPEHWFRVATTKSMARAL